MTLSARTRRIATLFAPAALAAAVTLRGAHTGVLELAAPALVIAWIVMVGALAMRFSEARELRRRAPGRPSHWDHLDILTAGGASASWLGAGALVASVITGWASLSVVGVLGLGTVYIAATWTAIVAGGDTPWRRATITRSIVPAICVEGDRLTEEVRLTGIAIPHGMRLFATGRAQRHGVISRYAVGSDGSGADVKLESDLGFASRGEHRAPPLALWLGDVLGLTRTPVVHRGEASFAVLPRPGAVDGVQQLFGSGGDHAISRPTFKLPTEGTFRLREYVPGDDTRRIHWVRSLQQDQLVVRLPDEIPPADPVVHLILDNELFGTEALTCRAVDELLDVLVRVWLGIAKALTDAGTRVTLVTAGDKAGVIGRIEQEIGRQMLARASRDGLRLGARVAWQAELSLDALIDARAAKQVVVSCRPRRRKSAAEISWVVVPDVGWTSPEPGFPENPAATLPFPTGAADNRKSRRVEERRRIEKMWHDRMLFSQVVCWADWARFSGEYVACPKRGRIALEVIP